MKACDQDSSEDALPASSHCYMAGESNGFAQLRSGSQGSERQRPRAKQEEDRSHASEGPDFPGSSCSCADNQVTLTHARGSLSHLSESGSWPHIKCIEAKNSLVPEESGTVGSETPALEQQRSPKHTTKWFGDLEISGVLC